MTAVQDSTGRRVSIACAPRKPLIERRPSGPVRAPVFIPRHTGLIVFCRISVPAVMCAVLHAPGRICLGRSRGGGRRAVRLFVEDLEGEQHEKLLVPDDFERFFENLGTPAEELVLPARPFVPAPYKLRSVPGEFDVRFLPGHQWHTGS
ncbi:hypothetical protein [Streptomyces collinus]|uniref:hypothetical protein n=1 Tax=Streptomyces collinus TaxID=42684 RepID=UPI0033C90FD9